MIRFFRKWRDGHVTIGPLTLYGDNAMHWQADLRLPLGLYLCARPPQKSWPWSVYLSTNATPWAALVAFGPGVDREDKERARVRRRGLRKLLHANWFEGAGYDETQLEVAIEVRAEKADSTP